MRVRRITKLCLVLLILGVVAVAVLAAQDLQPAGGSGYLTRAFQRAQGMVSRLHRSLAAKEILFILILLVGLLVTVLQSIQTIRKKKWVVILVAVAGAGITGLTAVNTEVFTFSTTSARESVAKADILLNSMDLMREQYQIADDGEKKQLVGAFQDCFDHIVELTRTLYNAGTSASAPVLVPGIVTRVYAKENPPAPDWVNRPPRDASQLYARGTASSRSLAEAKRAALEAATSDLSRTIRSSVSAPAGDQLASFLATRSTVADSYFYFDQSKGLFHYYVLVGLRKQYLDDYLLSFELKNQRSLPPPEKSRILRTLQSAASTY